MTNRAFLCVALLATTVMPQTVFAQDVRESASDDVLSGEIIVTARKREERAIDVPASINVFSGDTLAATGVTSLVDLQFQTPGLKIAQGGGGTRVSLRGVGTNISSGSPSVAVHIDGIYIPRPRFALTEMFDIGRVEVLKGPEGTLYGRNATGGAINIVTEGPGPELAADGYVGYGSRDLLTAQAGVSVPFDDRGGIRISAAFANDDGYTKNLNASGGEIDDRNYRAIRVKGDYDLSETLSASFTAQYVDDEGTVSFGNSNNPDSPVYASLPPEQRESARRINVDTPPESDQEGLLLSGTLSFDLGGVTLKSLTGYIDYKSTARVDVDGSGGFIAYSDTDSRSKFFSQEFQLSGGNADSVSWTTGLYYSKEKNRSSAVETDADYPDPTGFVYTDQTQVFKSRSAAIFGEATIALGTRSSVLVGARYTEEKQTGESAFAAPLFFPDPILRSSSVKDDAFTPKIVFEHRPYDGGKIYASITRGFKSGGASLSTTANTYKPEKIWAYEVGTKNRIAGGLAEISFAGFYYDYTDLQLRTVLFTDTGIISRITNAAKAEIYGAELSAAVHPAEGLTFDFNGAWIESELKNFVSPVTQTQLDGLPMPLTPKWSFTAGAQYSTPIGSAGKLTARGEVSYQSSVIFPQFTDLARERQGGYTLLNANLRYDLPGENIYVALIGRNLTNKHYLTQRFFFAGFADTEFYGTPRTIEARVGFKF